MENTRLSVSDFIALTNQTLEYAYPVVQVEGEVQGFKVNQNKYVFFDLKDESSSIGCFMTVWSLRTPLEDGMKVVVSASPKLTQWGKFSLTVKQVTPVGEGSIKRSFNLLVAKLTKEGLLDEARKRPLPALPAHIGVIASTESAGYADFIKILDERWGGLKVDVVHVQVQGAQAAAQIINALAHFNQADPLPQVIAIIRGGGSLDDLSTFNDEPLARAIASSRVPTITGIGHETDTGLADMVADYRGATPTNVAQILVPDKREIKDRLQRDLEQNKLFIVQNITETEAHLKRSMQRAAQQVYSRLDITHERLAALKRTLGQLHPETVLKKGYALVRNANGKLVDVKVKKGDQLFIELKTAIIKAGVTDVKSK